MLIEVRRWLLDGTKHTIVADAGVGVIAETNVGIITVAEALQAEDARYDAQIENDLDALEQAIYDRRGADTGDLVHHSDRGTQYLSMRYTERLADAGIALSVGSRGDAYDNALAETIIGLFKTEVIRRRGPWRHIDAVEFATLAWVDWFNTRRLLEPIGYIPPAEYEERYYEQATVA